MSQIVADRTDAGRVRAGRVTVGRVLVGIAAGTALLAAVSTIPAVLDASRTERIPQTWWLYGLVVFAGLFALLAAHPLRVRWLWEIVLVNKLALTVTAVGYLAADSAADAGTVLVSDGGLFVLLLIAYCCVRGWRAGR